MVVYYHDSTVGDSGAHAIRVSTDSGSNYNNVSTTGFRIDTSTGANIKRTTVVCASFKVATAATFRMGVYGIGVNENQFRYMSGSQVDAGGCSPDAGRGRGQDRLEPTKTRVEPDQARIT